MKKTIFSTIIFFFTLLLFFPTSILAQEENSNETEAEETESTEAPIEEPSNGTEDREIKYKAKITELLIESCPDNIGEGDCYFFKLEIQTGDKKGEQVESIASIADDPKLPSLNYKVGKKVYLVETKVGGETQYYIKEPIRGTSLLTLVIIFIVFVVAVGGLQGLSSLAGLGISFVVLLLLVLPLMLSGTSPILASVLGGSLIMTVSIYLSHGFNRKTSIALIGTVISLIITAILAGIYTQASRLTGYSTEEATFLIQLIDKPINMQGVLLASLIIGGIGILDDITVSQVSTIVELFNANPSFSWKELFARSMKVGKDHIASMVNTLVLAYTGSALPLVMLFMASGASSQEIINTEMVAEEIVRTLVGSIGLILAVPITSLIASMIIAGGETRTVPRRYNR
ncbi:YibE/F family protein [Candidatus Dojkabacteria bacterium]|nr:YibE/F family protein [Candidatus Dojkabacteria bacterium]